MKRKSVWLSFTACALTVASVPLPARAVQRVEKPGTAQVCRGCPLFTGISLPSRVSLSAITDVSAPATAVSESAKGAAAYQPRLERSEGLGLTVPPATGLKARTISALS